MAKDLETECWSAHEAAKSAGDLGFQLKALELLVKIRVAGEKVKGDELGKRPTSSVLTRVHEEVNGRHA